MEKYSVLMSVYIKEKPENLRSSMESILNQTVNTDDFVLICDGPLGAELNAVIDDMKAAFGKTLRVYRLKKNHGLGRALRLGLKLCRNELVARMDSDDISFPDRCERQLNIFDQKPDISICSGTVEEFYTDKEHIISKKIVPENNDQILSFAKKRNPFNHPCVMLKKSDVIAAGSYRDFYLLEDYFLWTRMLIAGFKGYNIQKPILYMRSGSELYARRSGWKYALSQEKLFRYMLKKRFISFHRYMLNVTERIIVSTIPNVVREKLFRKLMRR